jgi:2-dehydro-3-deoxyphosphogluconate aldolase/(4S)-4-hydroxy-2-oxoglutarate aldolase
MCRVFNSAYPDAKRCPPHGGGRKSVYASLPISALIETYCRRPRIIVIFGLLANSLNASKPGNTTSMISPRHIIEHKLVAIIRGARPDEMLRIADALYEGGIRTLEVTLNSPGALEVIERVAAHAGDKMLVGAGTVLDAETARAALIAGAQFIVSPTLDIKTIGMTKKYGALSVPGAMTPTEILAAYSAGADVIKVFPASAVGPSFFREMAGPLPHIPLMPTGGVNLENIAAYAQAGAKAFGLGSSLTDTKNAMTEASLKALTQKAKDFFKSISETNG